jgi:hypothetical protein
VTSALPLLAFSAVISASIDWIWAWSFCAWSKEPDSQQPDLDDIAVHLGKLETKLWSTSWDLTGSG